VTDAAAVMLHDARLHLQHGPIDLIVEAFGKPEEVQASYQQARDRFRTILQELVLELSRLRAPWQTAGLGLQGAVARRMEAAVAEVGVTTSFVTPMAAVAGAVADEVLAALTRGRQLQRAYVNNGGDIALYLADGEVFDIGLIAVPARTELAGKVQLDGTMGVGGIATSGRGGRSLSLGIADAVTVLAKDAATADVAATLIANQVDLPGHAAIRREPASDLDPDSDLGERLVTTGVEPLTPAETTRALARGLTLADQLREQGTITAAALCLAGEVSICGESAEQQQLMQKRLLSGGTVCA